jgi:hypothetical protein
MRVFEMTARDDLARPGDVRVCIQTGCTSTVCTKGLTNQKLTRMIE